MANENYNQSHLPRKSVFSHRNLPEQLFQIKIEIDEHGDERELQTFVMVDQDVHERLINYYKKYLMEYHYHNDNLKPKAKEKLKVKIESDFNNMKIASQQEVEDYKWAMDIIKFGDDYSIFIKQTNTIASFHSDYNMWVLGKPTKIDDTSIIEDLKRLLLSPPMPEIKKHPIEKVNLNTCKYRDLYHIPNFSAKLYDDIVLYRENRSFESVDELGNALLGVSKVKINRLKEYFEV